MTKILHNFLEEEITESESVEENATFLLNVKSFILGKCRLLSTVLTLTVCKLK